MCEISMMSTLVALIQAFLTKTNQRQKEVRNDDHLKSGVYVTGNGEGVSVALISLHDFPKGQTLLSPAIQILYM